MTLKAKKGAYFCVRVTDPDVEAFARRLRHEERAAATVEKYRRDIRAFAVWLGDTAAQGDAHVMKESALAYKEHLKESLAPASVNAALAAMNGFFAFMGWDIKVKPLKIQRRTFCAAEKELSRSEYGRLLAAAGQAGNTRLDLILQTICATGIRVGELRYITVAAARCGQAVITNKGKTRTAFIPKTLAPMLLRYAKARGTISGSVFITKNGKPVDRKNIWADMKKLCAAAGVIPEKVFPHNLRHLFARTFYEKDKDIVRLADLLGHSDVKTTRIYTMESGAEHQRRVDALGLVNTT
jgi:site-specific recombinase XerD